MTGQIYIISPKESPLLRMLYERKYVTLIEYSGHDEKVRKWCHEKQRRKNDAAATFEWVEDDLQKG